jgi:hypothetical protein
VTSVTDKQVVLSNELSVVPAETPYLIYNDNDTEVAVSIVMTNSTADDVTVASEFKGTLVAQAMPASGNGTDYYVLSNGHDFVWVKDAGTIAANKCWLEISSSQAAGARRLSIVFEGGETTGIAGVNAANADRNDCYDLSGRRVMQPTKGLYIIGGKKVVVK